MAVVPSRRLPSTPHLDDLRKQAKDLLDLYRSGDSGAVTEVKQFEWHAHPARFDLDDAQGVLARAYGFESWPKLKAFVDGANVKRLTDAVDAGDLSQVRVLLNMRPELIGMDMSRGDERQALHLAVLRRNLAMVRLLMEAGADARKGVYPHRDATTALAIARDRGYDEVVHVIEEEERRRREENSCPNATVSPVQDRIAAAMHSGDTGEAMRLLDADKSLIQACDLHGASPLHIAAQTWNLELVEWLLDRRANIGKQDEFALTPLDRAALAATRRNDGARQFPPVARLMLHRGAPLTLIAAVALGRLDRMRELAADPAFVREIGPVGGLLTVAVVHRQVEAARLLLDLGADVDERILLKELEEPTVSWGGPLWHAARIGDREMAELLLNRGADPNANVYASGWPIRNAWFHEDESVKRLLLERGARLPPPMLGELHRVEEARQLLAEEGTEQLAAELLEAAADSGCPSIVEMALQWLDWPRKDSKWHWYFIQPIRGIGSDRASHEGHFECMRLLLRHGIDPNVASLGETALHFTAAWHGHVSETERARFAELLLDHGARLDVRDEMLHSTPLGWACRWGRPEMIKVLLERGADPIEKDAEPWATPTAWAQKFDHDHVLGLLREYRT
ncbi:MAG TPA: ankyrin repeat domain-containing protein [Bryobacteraceae bacterium]|nr:ankyrin repeat domain-containing protein [Bryobacteraceae bacterium]